jgi:hypothetical protein
MEGERVRDPWAETCHGHLSRRGTSQRREHLDGGRLTSAVGSSIPKSSPWATSKERSTTADISFLWRTKPVVVIDAPRVLQSDGVHGDRLVAHPSASCASLRTSEVRTPRRSSHGGHTPHTTPPRNGPRWWRAKQTILCRREGAIYTWSAQSRAAYQERRTS